jgi:hypothetical protein
MKALGLHVTAQVHLYDLRAMKPGGAARTFEERLKGTIEPGKLADLVVLDKDILTCEPQRIPDIGVSLTMVGGRIAFRR